VHAQVPVEVATFLLNEKRADIAKLEARLRVSVILIPNKFIDTPHYHIERLKHDDPRLDDVKASFERAAELAPSTDTPYASWQGERRTDRGRGRKRS
jgi:ribonuclease E